jgi:hypothetical protein
MPKQKQQLQLQSATTLLLVDMELDESAAAASALCHASCTRIPAFNTLCPVIVNLNVIHVHQLRLDSF